ncbi:MULTISPECIES: hypothetical protein [Butyricimonas]|uniref:Na+-driven multidrug efflux pump n=1 Tax=Butyricimonas hominis TaxID=2763032 RepID=A0ABR7D4N4_9BACT|nr:MULTISPECIES: hypothetical protein [Butyricimonas]MBC5622722.1 hypothetical protein [Butyricimonas hominis]
MKPSNVVIVNTVFLYVKIVLTAFITLFSTRIILDVLGVEDFGIYNLIAGSVAILSFLNGAMMVSTQRYLSVCLGSNDASKLFKIFNTSFILHIAIALLIFFVIEILGLWLFDGILKFDLERFDVAKLVYHIVAFTLFVTIVGVPYNAAINAREDMWFFALVEILLVVLKLLAAFYLYYTPYDALVVFAVSTLLITFVGYIIKWWWCQWHYQETKIDIKRGVDFKILKEILAFCGWNTLGAAAQVGRNQGTAVVLNVFWGTLANAAYGITNQVNGLLVSFSQTLTSAIAPQIMKSKGSENQSRMLYLAMLSCKFSFFLSSLWGVILLSELPLILRFWLKEVPVNTIEFCRWTIWIFLIMQLYPGLVRALQADGRIKYYQIAISILLLLPLLIGCGLFAWGFSINSIFGVMIFAQVMTLCVTLYFSKIYVGLIIKDYLWNVVLKSCMMFSVSLLVAYIFHYIENEWLRFISVVLTALITQCLFFGKIILSGTEREKVYSIACKLICKIFGNVNEKRFS